MYNEILMPTDGSQGSIAAAEHAIELATTYDAALHALYVVQTTVAPEADMSGVYEAFEEAGSDAVDNVVERAEAAGVGTVQAQLAHGSPHEQIIAYANDHDIDIIVMGTHGRTGLDRYLLGSVTEKVVRLADVPVMTVRMPQERTAGET